MTKHETPPGNPVLLVATRKGAWLYHADAARRTWRVDGPHFLGHIVSHLVLDPRDGSTLLAAAKTGHLGPTLFRSTDLGRTFTEASRPPAFATRMTGYAVGFFFFWLVSSLSSLLTLYLVRTAHPEPPDGGQTEAQGRSPE